MPEKMKYRFKRGLANKRLGEFAKAETDFKYVLKKQKGYLAFYLNKNSNKV